MKLKDIGGMAYGRDHHSEKGQTPVEQEHDDDEASKHPGWLRWATTEVLKRPQLAIDTAIALIALQEELPLSTVAYPPL